VPQHVLGQRRDHRDRAQATEDAADAESVADGLAHTVLGRDLEVGERRGVPPDLDLIDDVPGSV
jgi:hypothetical protein